MAPDQRRHYIQKLHGGERDIHDYLAEEVVNCLESDRQDFLLATCSLNRFSFPGAAQLYPKGDALGNTQETDLSARGPLPPTASRILATPRPQALKATLPQPHKEWGPPFSSAKQNQPRYRRRVHSGPL